MEDEGKRVCVVGPRRLQNELMAVYIQSRTGIRCSVLVLPARPWPSDLEGGRGQRLILFDCQGPGLEDLPEILARDPAEAPGVTFLALFNLRAGAGVESSALDMGFRGFFYEHDCADTLLKGIDAIFSGEFWASRRLLAEYVLDAGKGKTLCHKGRQDLTPREIEILAMLASGATNRMIAEKLCISPHTVKTHLYRIFKKIKVINRLQAAQWAADRL